MPLPRQAVTSFLVKLPSTGKQLEMRPFLVKEEKILYIALESGDVEEIQRGIQNVLVSCTLGKLDVDALTSFDLEFLFIKLRAKSVNEIAEVGIIHEGCEKPTPISINFDTVEVNVKKKDRIIKFDDVHGITMRYPSLKDLEELKGFKKNTDKLFTLIDRVMINAFDADDVYDDFTVEEVGEYIEHLTTAQFNKVMKFLTNQPQIEVNVPYTCVECGAEVEQKIQGLRNFFKLGSPTTA